MVYKQTQKNQSWLLPLDIKEMIPKDHVCFLVEDFVEKLDYKKFDMIYAGAGNPAYHPRILMKILVQGMLSKVRSSRKLAQATRENVVMMYLAEKVNPDFRTIARFRKENEAFVKEAFKKTVEIAAEHKLIDLSFLSIDGSMIKAYAGRKQYVDKKGLDLLDKAIDKMIKEDIALDELEEQMFGDKEDGLTGIDKRDMKKIVREYYSRKDKKQVKENIEKAKNELEKYGLEKVSLTDPSCRKIYSLRKITVEPVYGHMKQNLGFREFLLRGLEKVKMEMNLLSIAHNLGKIHRMMAENNGFGEKNSQYFALFRNFFASST